MENKKLKVMIGTPSYDGKLEAWYVNSLIQTIKLSYTKNIDILSIWVSYDALVQRARNDTVAIALDLDVDALIFIDADISWDPEAVFQLIDYKEDVVGGTYTKKTDTEVNFPIYNPKNNWVKEQNGLIEVDGLGTGFLKFSKKALQYLWDNSKAYYDIDKPEEKRMIFDIRIDDNTKLLVSEDINACWKLKNGGFKIYLDPKISCGHIGYKHYFNNFEQVLTQMVNGPNTPVQSNNRIDDDTII